MIQWSEVILSSEKFLDLSIQIGSTLLVVLLIVSVGLVASLILAAVARKLTVWSGLDALIEKFGISRYWYAVGVRMGAAEIVARFVKWTVLIATVFVAIDVLGIRTFDVAASKFLGFLPDLAIGVSIMLGGLVAAEWVGRAVESFLEASHLIESPKLVANAVHIVLIVAFVLISAEQIGVKIDLFRQSLLLLIASILLAATLAVGFGAREIMQNTLHGFYIRKLVKTGQSIHIGDQYSGQVLAFAPQHLVVKSAEGEVLVNYTFCIENNFVIEHNEQNDADSDSS